MDDRPYSTKLTAELQELFRAQADNPSVLELLAAELGIRTKQKAKRLLEQVEQALERASTISKNCRSSCHTPIPPTPGWEIATDNWTTPSSPIVAMSWDKEQRSVIEEDETDFLVVEAGPGSGKTAVACARVASLIENYGLTAAKILLVSFTRTAVKELRDRIRSYAEDPYNVVGLKIVTLDSFTFEVVKGLGDQAEGDLFGSYDENIGSFLDLLRENDKGLLEYLGELEHVVMDEGQDLVGVRADLALEIINALPEECGVTVFADSAQAIYGFTDDYVNGRKEPSRTVVERIADGEAGRFIRILLENNHRTEDPKLQQLVLEGRRKLVDLRESSEESWLATRELIERLCHGAVDVVEKQDLKSRSDTLVLYRSRAEVLMASSYLWGNGVAHKVRMSGIPPRVLPWIGRLLGSCTEDYLERSEFETFSSECIGDSPAFDEARWALLLSQAGDRSGRIGLLRLRELLARDRPPVDFLVDETELDGPVLGTIHASKGREADRVHLMLPGEDFLTDRKEPPTACQIAEEERVLYVGATRARSFLFCGRGSKLRASRLESGRIHRGIRMSPAARQVEIGLLGDINPASVADDRRTIAEAEQLQEWFWSMRTTVVVLESRYNPDNGEIVLWQVDGGEELAVCALSQSFKHDLFRVGEAAAKAAKRALHKPWSKIRNIRMVGVSTVVIPEAERGALLPPWRHSGFLLVPVITGFPKVSFDFF